jgi:uncharacterized protein YrzB (UPF0473 family)
LGWPTDPHHPGAIRRSHKTDRVPAERNGNHMNEEYNPDIVTLSNEDGEEYTFEIIDGIETDDSRYLALLPVFDKPEDKVDDNGELVILKVFEDEEGEYYEEIDDDDEYETIADAFVSRLQDLFEIDEEEPVS